MSRAVKSRLPPRQLPDILVACRLSASESFLNIGDDICRNVGERTNVTGLATNLAPDQKKRNTAKRWMSPAQVESGAQIIDINMG